MDNNINNGRTKLGAWGTAVTICAAGALLAVSGRSQLWRPSRQQVAPAAVLRDRLEVATAASTTVREESKSTVSGNASAGERRYLQTCAVCHGPSGLGQPHMGANLRDSRFIHEKSDEALLAFIKAGRPLGDPRSVLGLSMPPLGGNPTLEDGQLSDIVAFLRTLQANGAVQGAEAQVN
jgi:mono/diheme cytochrome c family protein